VILRLNEEAIVVNGNDVLAFENTLKYVRTRVACLYDWPNYSYTTIVVCCCGYYDDDYYNSYSYSYLYVNVNNSRL
jgi:hypothetical protein